MSVSFVHISRMHQITLDDECSKFQCLMDWTPEHATCVCDIVLNLYCMFLMSNIHYSISFMHSHNGCSQQPELYRINRYGSLHEFFKISKKFHICIMKFDIIKSWFSSSFVLWRTRLSFTIHGLHVQSFKGLLQICMLVDSILLRLL